MRINMHRVETGKQSDWDGLAYEDMNKHQKRAFDTNGIDTPGNRATGARVALGILSLVSIKAGRTRAGLIGLGVSLAGDWLDGYRAEKTHTKSVRNGKLDAIADMVIRAATLPVLASEGIISTRYARTLAIENGINTVATAINTAVGHDARSNLPGKAKTVAEGASLLAAGVNYLYPGDERTGMQSVERWTKAASVLGNAAAAAGYIIEIFQPVSQLPQNPLSE